MKQKEEVVYITKEFALNMKELGLGIIDKIYIYRREKDKVYFSAGKGKFHMTESELEEVKLR